MPQKANEEEIDFLCGQLLEMDGTVGGIFQVVIKQLREERDEAREEVARLRGCFERLGITETGMRANY